MKTNVPLTEKEGQYSDQRTQMTEERRIRNRKEGSDDIAASLANCYDMGRNRKNGHIWGASKQYLRARASINSYHERSCSQSEGTRDLCKLRTVTLPRFALLLRASWTQRGKRGEGQV